MPNHEHRSRRFLLARQDADRILDSLSAGNTATPSEIDALRWFVWRGSKRAFPYSGDVPKAERYITVKRETKAYSLNGRDGSERGTLTDVKV